MIKRFQSLYSGRISLEHYWFSWVVLVLTCFVFAVIFLTVFSVFAGFPLGKETSYWLLILGIPNLFIWQSLLVRRFHDLGWSGWIFLLVFVPLLNLILILCAMLLPGKTAENKFGLRHPSKNPFSIIFNRKSSQAVIKGEKWVPFIALVTSVIAGIYLISNLY